MQFLSLWTFAIDLRYSLSAVEECPRMVRCMGLIVVPVVQVCPT